MYTDIRMMYENPQLYNEDNRWYANGGACGYRPMRWLGFWAGWETVTGSSLVFEFGKCWYTDDAMRGC